MDTYTLGVVNVGNTWWVDSVNGNANNSGKEKDKSLVTIEAAVNASAPNDTIVVMPGHAETIATAGALTFDKAGVTIIGIGNGTTRPTLTMSATASSVIVSAVSVHIENLLFINTAAVVITLDVNATDCHIHNCEFRMGTGITAIDIDGGSNNAADRCHVIDCVIDGVTDGPDRAIELGDAQDAIVIHGNWIYGQFDQAAIHNVGSSVCTWMRITDNWIVNTEVASHSIELLSACTGIMANNMCESPLADNTPTDIDGGSMAMLENYSTDSQANVSGLLNPVADS